MLNVPANALVALAAAAAWGGGDFAGGMGVKAAGRSFRGALKIIVIAHFASLGVLVTIWYIRGGPFPTGAPLFWGLGGGIIAGLSLASFYLALAQGAMGASAAVSGLLAAAIPVLVSSILEGASGWQRASGFAVALAAIWLIAADEGNTSDAAPNSTGKKTMSLAVLSGVGFGLYFVALQRTNVLGTSDPMMLARIGSACTCLLMLAMVAKSPDEGKGMMNASALRWACGVALLDTPGNLLFIAATRLGRLDVAAVLASLYPASTILLAAWKLRERPSRRQGVGMAFAVVAVALITL